MVTLGNHLLFSAQADDFLFDQIQRPLPPYTGAGHVLPDTGADHVLPDTSSGHVLPYAGAGNFPPRYWCTTYFTRI